MAGWTIVATTLGASAITGAVGYWSSWLQSRVGLEQARVALEQLRVQHREDHLRNRQATYHQFLDAASTAERIREETRSIFGDEPFDAEAEAAVEAQQKEFRHLLNGVRLFGTTPVREAADAVDAAYHAFTVEWWSRLGSARKAGQQVRQSDLVPGHLMPAVDEAISDLVDAMRTDVAPD